MSHLVISENVGLFVNTLTPNDTYSFVNREDLLQTIEMQYLRNKKFPSEVFDQFLKSTSNLEHLGKKDCPHPLCISEITNCERRG